MKIRTAIVARLRRYSAPSESEGLFWPISVSSKVDICVESTIMLVSDEGCIIRRSSALHRSREQGSRYILYVHSIWLRSGSKKAINNRILMI